MPARLAETRQIALAQGKSPMRICDAHGLSELRLRMRADPGDEQKAAQHNEGVNFSLFLGGECADPAIAPHPRFEELRHLRIVLEKTTPSLRNHRGTRKTRSRRSR